MTEWYNVARREKELLLQPDEEYFPITAYLEWFYSIMLQQLANN